MKRFFTKFGMLVVMLLTFLQASAYDFEVDGIYYEMVSFDNPTCKVVKGDKEYEGDIVIPNMVTYMNREIAVVAMDAKAFFECSSLTSIAIPNSVTKIEPKTFSGCSSLTSVTIPDSVTEIGDYAFYRCSSLTSVTIPDSVTEIGNYAFYRCSSLTSVTIPDSVTRINSETFDGCSSLTSITIPGSVTKIDNYAFSGCSSLTSVAIPDSVTKIGIYAFSGCSSLTSVTISDSVIEIGDNVFSGCISLTSVFLSSNLKLIRYGLFEGCKQLEKLTIPGGVEAIQMYLSLGSNYEDSDWTFGNCDNLKEMEISWNTFPLEFGYLRSSYGFNLLGSSKIFISGKGLNIPLEKITIDRELKWRLAFMSLPYLKDYVMGEHLTKNQVDLSKSEQLESITCYAANPPELGDVITNAQYMSLKVLVPDEYLEAYKQADGWKNFWNLSGVDEVKNDASERFETGRYSLSGQRVSEDYDGMVIIRYSDGSSKKVMQK